MRFHLHSSQRPASARQSMFAFRQRIERRDRAFKGMILLATAMAIVGMIGGSPRGRHAVSSFGRRVRWAAEQPLGLEPSREEINADWQSLRELNVRETRQRFEEVFGDTNAGMQRILRAGGMAPDSALFRWGNFDSVLLLSSQVFEPDDSGRSYRLRPGIRTFWVRGLKLPKDLPGVFLVPDIAEVRAAVESTHSRVVTGSEQTTNSWGCRGPEPDLTAPMRGLVLGDSYMQGVFVGDQETPPAFLQQDLQEAWHVPVTILNTGHLGYSIEQYFYTLREYAPRLKPRFVVVSLFANDFGQTLSTLKGEVDWKEAEYWLGEITQYCESRQITCL
ncbi:MAG TPA: SGNH/GDSL hydrolase family protein, partial [Isosphaeraceae bacterium]|nr:SGNH/GDSL hydrolase family protein [Isosphaeraceae bacterium]